MKNTKRAITPLIEPLAPTKGIVLVWENIKKCSTNKAKHQVKQKCVKILWLTRAAPKISKNHIAKQM